MLKPIYYHMKDFVAEGEFRDMRVADRSELKKFNDLGHGIFWTFNEFKENRRVKENILKINFWAIEIDNGSKELQLEKIKAGPVPSLVIETKRGFHVYFFAKDASVENYRGILVDRLIPYYGADDLKDYTRVYRVPNFYHCKDINNKFLVTLHWYKEIYYSESDMRFLFKDVNATKKIEYIEKIKASFGTGNESDNVWQRIYDMDQMVALEKISGTSAVAFENFSFKRSSRGHHNIFVNGKPTNCFIDEFGKIGANGGGPTIAQWINWYHKDYKITVKYLREIFPEVFRE